MAQRLAIIDYGSGNLRSVARAATRAAADHGLGVVVEVTDDAAAIKNADRIILPGVGAFGACAAGLSARSGVLEALEHAVLAAGRPFLGVCVGMQLLAECGREFGDHDGLGWIEGEVTPLDVGDSGLKTPHMGWSPITATAPHPLLAGLDGASFYFAHSYRFEVQNASHEIALCRHGEAFTAAVARDNIAGMQFHPEKSQTAGLALLGAFLRWAP